MMYEEVKGMDINMKTNTLGKILQEKRESQGFSREKVCRGLCSIMALARYERNERVPDKFLADALLERLGLNPFRYEFIVSDQEFSFSMERECIEKMLYKGDDNIVWEALERYEKGIQKKDILHYQYIMLKRAILLGRVRRYKEAVKLLKVALRYTKCSDEELLKQGTFLLTGTEIELYYLLGKFQYLLGETHEACNVFMMIKNYIEHKQWDSEKWKEFYPHILYRLAQFELNKHNFGKSYSYLKKAEEILVEEYRIDNLYEILELKKEVCLKLGIKNETNEMFEIALKLISMSENGRLSKEGMNLWESTVNQQL